MRRAAALFVVLAAVLTQRGGALVAAQADGAGVARLLLRIEQVMQAGDPDAYLDLLSAVADRDFARDASRNLVLPGITRAVIRERDRSSLDGTLPGDGYRLMIEVLTERGIQGRVGTWRLDVRRVPTDTSEDEWRIAGQKQATTIDGLYRLSLNPATQYRVTNLLLTSDDLEVRLASGHAFVAETPDGPTAVVLVPGSGAAFRFRPTPTTEREQVRFYAGADAVEAPFDLVFVRVHPGDFAAKFPPGSLTAEPVDPTRFRRAEAYFREQIGKAFTIDLADLSRGLWSLPPSPGDLLVDFRTRRFRDLTYTKSNGDAEDITFFDRRRRRNISVYASQPRKPGTGRYFNEDDGAAYDIQHYEIDASYDPDRQWLEGRALLKLRVKSLSANNIMLRLAEPLTVRSIYSTDLGRLLSLRVRGQNNIVINLPAFATRGTEMTLVVAYGGRLVPSEPDREVAGPFPQQDQTSRDEVPLFASEPSTIFSTRTYWYPQGSASDYATATMRLMVPESFGVLASGEPAAGSPAVVPPREGQPGWRMFTFEATQPVRYLSWAISRFNLADSRTISLVDALTSLAANGGTAIPAGAVGAGAFTNTLSLAVESNPRLVSRGRAMAPVAEDILQYFTSVVGDCPYPAYTVGLVEKDLPGGHSPAYLSIVYHPPPNASLNWSNDPSAFQQFPHFFIAHETAHQWWGQAVGWRSYHDQWISEGFAQYFAALYARKSRGEEVFADMLRRMVKWARDQGDKGPVSLGYRLGHIQGDSRIFRALVYNKAAVVLDMLRRQLGDEAFFRGVRRFYFTSRFQKAGSEDVREALARESGVSLEAFFDAWIHGSGTPRVRVSWQRAAGGGSAAVVKVEQVGRVFPFPVTATIRYADGTLEDAPILVSGQITEVRLPLKGAMRDITLNRDGLTPLNIVK